MIPQIRPGIEPQIQDLAQPGLAEINVASGIDETDERNLFIVEGFEQALGHRADARKTSRTAIAAARQIIDGDSHLASRCGQGGSPQEE
jgi:hypothetical protein